MKVVNLYKSLVLLLILLTVLLSFPTLVAAGTFNVTRTDDPAPGACNAGDCSLREAVIAANAAVGADTINLPSGTYNLTIGGSGENASMTGDLDVTGNLTITGDRATISANGLAPRDRVLHVIGANLTMSGATLSGGLETNGGGMLVEAGSVANLSECTISGNSADRGGGIRNNGSLTMEESTISGNSANVHGGGLYTGGVSSNLTNCTISGNTASDSGGGCYNAAPAFTTLTFVTAALNTADTGNGGGLFRAGGTFNLQESLIAGNVDSAGPVHPDCSGAFNSWGYNFIGDTSGAFGFVGTDIVNLGRPLSDIVDPLASNGGPTRTHALVLNSPAINGGSPMFGGPPYTDQRGPGYPRIRGWTVDIGAFEYDTGGSGGSDTTGGCYFETSSGN